MPAFSIENGSDVAKPCCDSAGIREERLHGESVRTLLVVGEAVLLLEPRPERRVGGRGDRDRLALQVLDLRHTRMRDEHRRVLLERRGDRRQRHVLLDRRQHLQAVGHRDVELAGGEQLQAVDLRPAHPDRDVEPVLPVRAFRQRLVEAPVLRLREPVGGEHDAILRGAGAGPRNHEKRGTGASEPDGACEIPLPWRGRIARAAALAGAAHERGRIAHSRMREGATSPRPCALRWFADVVPTPTRSSRRRGARRRNA